MIEIEGRLISIDNEKLHLASFCDQKSIGSSKANKCITQLTINGNIINDPVKIFNEESKFYVKLYVDPDEEDLHHQTKIEDI